MSRSIYYAAPFFNPEEMNVMHHVQHIATPKKHLKLFYPYEASAQEQSNIQDAETRRRVYLKNEQALIHSAELLAWVDRKQMNGQQVQLCHDEDLSDRTVWVGDGKELKQPDLGTVWEMGFARARGKVIAAFTLQEKKEAKLNLMLTESVDIVLYGWQELEEYLAIPEPFQIAKYIRERASFWKGEVE